MNLSAFFHKPISAIPIGLFRILFGFMMFAGGIRFVSMGWLDEQLIHPVFHFHYYGFEWIKPLYAQYMYIMYGLMVASSLTLAIGLFTRISALLFFLLFTYFELIDLTYYLNHYYFISLIAFLLCILPVGRILSVDVLLHPRSAIAFVPAWVVYLLRFQVGIVYVYAGIAKCTPHWLFEAMPLKIWLPAQAHWPVIGEWLAHPLTPWLFSWTGMLFDTFIPFVLMSRFWVFGYILVILFHSLTGLFFPIGMFPLIMILMVWIFFPLSFLEKCSSLLSRLIPFPSGPERQWIPTRFSATIIPSFLAVYILFQLLFPFRYVLYSGDRFWTEQGYRFGWRVMLMEKSGQATFYIRDSSLGREWEVVNRDFLNAHQEKQMSMQPDMILQFAHFLADTFSRRGISSPSVRVEAYVTLNGNPSQLLIDPSTDLTTIQDGWVEKKWILPSPYEKKEMR